MDDESFEYRKTFEWPQVGGGKHLERSNVERPIFRNFKISDIKITKVELFDFSIFEFIFYFYFFFNSTNTQNTHMINNLLNLKVLEF